MRGWLLLWSAMKRLPALSRATPKAKAKRALVAAILSPLKPEMPLPATVVMIPEVSTLRMRLLFRSAMKRLPALSRATPTGLQTNWRWWPGRHRH